MTSEEQKDALGATFTNYEKVSWRRKQKNIEKLVEELEPIQESILDLIVKKNAIMDKITVVRKQMVLECVHPADHLIVREDDTLYCKFCERSMGLVQRHDNIEK